MKSKAPLLLIEQLLMILIFALASAICVQAFVLSDRISRKSAAQDQAVIAAQTAAEVWKSCGGDPKLAAAALGGEARQDSWTLSYDADWKLLSGQDAQDAVYRTELKAEPSEIAGLRKASVEVCGESETEPIYTLSAACQEAVS